MQNLSQISNGVDKILLVDVYISRLFYLLKHFYYTNAIATQGCWKILVVLTKKEKRENEIIGTILRARWSFKTIQRQRWTFEKSQWWTRGRQVLEHTWRTDSIDNDQNLKYLLYKHLKLVEFNECTSTAYGYASSLLQWLGRYPMRKDDDPMDAAWMDNEETRYTTRELNPDGA